MLEIRRITANEIKEKDKINTVVYNGRWDFSKDYDSGPLSHPYEWYWGAFENGRMVSKFDETPYVMRFDGNDAKMSGIGGIGTLPEDRKGGKVSQMFEKILPDEYENGFIFSNLCPFNHLFYRNFGYETCCARNEITVPVDQFESLKREGSFTLMHPGDDTSALQTIHEKYITDLNHAIRRDVWTGNRAWRMFTRNDPYKTGKYLYIWSDDAGNARSYIKYRHEKNKVDDDINHMVVEELAFMDKEALYAIFSLAGALSSQMDTLIWMMPTFIDPFDFIDLDWNVELKKFPRDMTRIVNVKQALTLMRKPESEGSFIIETSDPIIKENTARWMVEYGREGKYIAKTQKNADIVCDMPSLAQLITGYRTLENLLFSSRACVEVHGNRKLLDSVFTQRPQHLTEDF